MLLIVGCSRISISNKCLKVSDWAGIATSENNLKEMELMNCEIFIKNHNQDKKPNIRCIPKQAKAKIKNVDFNFLQENLCCLLLLNSEIYCSNFCRILIVKAGWRLERFGVSKLEFFLRRFWFVQYIIPSAMVTTKSTTEPLASQKTVCRSHLSLTGNTEVEFVTETRTEGMLIWIVGSLKCIKGRCRRNIQALGPINNKN